MVTMINRRLTVFFMIATILTLATLGTIFLAQGYRVNLSKRTVQKTGMLIISSAPGDAKIFLDGRLVETTNATVSSLDPGKHQLEIAKENYITWKKEVEVVPEMATEIDAFLVSKSPRLEPLTKTGVALLAPSPDARQIIYTSRNEGAKGAWMLDLASPPLIGIVRENPRPLVLDDDKYSYSLADGIRISPRGDQMMLTLNKQGHVLVSLANGSSPTATNSAEPTLALWEKEAAALKERWAKQLNLTEELMKIATDTNTTWSPNRKLFLYSKERDDYVEWHVYNGEEPLGVGKQREYLPLKFKKDDAAIVFWHQTNQHLIVQKGGTISLIETDGGNQTEVSSLELADPQVFSTPDGASLIILTSLKKSGLPQLYAIGLR